MPMRIWNKQEESDCGVLKAPHWRRVAGPGDTRLLGASLEIRTGHLPKRYRLNQLPWYVRLKFEVVLNGFPGVL